MANPITWRNVSGPSMGNPASGVGQAADTITSGVDILTGILRDRQDREEGYYNREKERNTQNYLDAVAGISSLGNFDAQAQAIQELRSAGPIDQSAVRGAVDARRTALMTQDTARRQFELGQAIDAARPIREQVEALVAKKDYEAANKIMQEQGSTFDAAGIRGELRQQIESAILADTNLTNTRRGDLYDADTEGQDREWQTNLQQFREDNPYQTDYTSLGENQKELKHVIKAFEGNKFMANKQFFGWFDDTDSANFIDDIVDKVVEGTGISSGTAYALMEKVAGGIGQAGDGVFANDDIADLDRDDLVRMLFGHAERYQQDRANQLKVEAEERKYNAWRRNRDINAVRVRQGLGEVSLPEPPPAEVPAEAPEANVQRLETLAEAPQTPDQVQQIREAQTPPQAGNQVSEPWVRPGFMKRGIEGIGSWFEQAQLNKAVLAPGQNMDGFSEEQLMSVLLDLSPNEVKARARITRALARRRD